MATKTADPVKTLQREVIALAKRVETLEAERPGRKAKPLVAVRQRGVCAIDPNRDSTTCEDASIYRYQMGCHGEACRARQHDAYERRKDRRETKTAVSVRSTKKAAVKKQAAPSKKVTKKTASSNGK